MEKLRTYLLAMKDIERAAFALKCKTSHGYLLKAIRAKEKLRAELCIDIDRESGGIVTVHDLRPDIDWAYLERVKYEVVRIAPRVRTAGA